jgi:hypothetical protein
MATEPIPFIELQPSERDYAYAELVRELSRPGLYFNPKRLLALERGWAYDPDEPLDEAPPRERWPR